jgi:hypothetical protein
VPLDGGADLVAPRVDRQRRIKRDFRARYDVPC